VRNIQRGGGGTAAAGGEVDAAAAEDEGVPGRSYRRTRRG
jgi:hypothetical protein